MRVLQTTNEINDERKNRIELMAKCCGSYEIHVAIDSYPFGCNKLKIEHTKCREADIVVSVIRLNSINSSLKI